VVRRADSRGLCTDDSIYKWEVLAIGKVNWGVQFHFRSTKTKGVQSKHK